MISVTAVRRIATVVCAAGLLFSSPTHAGWDEAVAAYARGDYATTFRELKPLAERGIATAQYNLGLMYYKGLGVSRNYAEAAKWYRKAAEQDKLGAQRNLGIMYDNGWGVAQDYAEAVKWYRKAAEQGDAFAQFELGLMYYQGHGVPQDYAVAHMWSNLGAARGNKRAAVLRDALADLMTPAQIAEAQRLAREWMEKHGQ